MRSPSTMPTRVLDPVPKGGACSQPRPPPWGIPSISIFLSTSSSSFCFFAPLLFPLCSLFCGFSGVPNTYLGVLTNGGTTSGYSAHSTSTFWLRGVLYHSSPSYRGQGFRTITSFFRRLILRQGNVLFNYETGRDAASRVVDTSHFYNFHLFRNFYHRAGSFVQSRGLAHIHRFRVKLSSVGPIYTSFYHRFRVVVRGRFRPMAVTGFRRFFYLLLRVHFQGFLLPRLCRDNTAFRYFLCLLVWYFVTRPNTINRHVGTRLFFFRVVRYFFLLRIVPLWRTQRRGVCATYGYTCFSFITVPPQV